MKIFKSIKWRLQIGYGFFLFITIAALTGTSYQLERDRQLNNIDHYLNAHFSALLDLMQKPPPFQPDEPLPEAPPPERPFPNHPPRRFHLPPPAVSSFINEPAFDEPGISRTYYVFWSPDGEELLRSTNAPSNLTMPPERHDLRTRGNYRELLGPVPGFEILVGRSIAPELDELRNYLLKQIAAGVFMLGVGLFIGLKIASRAIKPIEEISSAATKISAGDLSQRINVAEAESELGRLAAVLNSTFARLETAFAQQKQFATDAAHELRTPVSVMLTQTQTALNRERSAAEYRETIEACQRASQRMRKLIESLLELARLDAGQEPMKRMKFDLSQTAWDCVELVRPLAAERSVKIHCDLPAVDGHGDPERLAQVITNLLANAVQYNQVNGEVRISAKLQGSMILLAVSDTGTGISSEDLPHVFERFYRADASRSSGQTGLGLAISKAIVEAHGGTIEVASQPGAGTTFTVVLPTGL
jgi:heavy metal sensor kinase